MKELYHLDFVQRAVMICRLLPDEMPGYLLFAKAIAERVQQSSAILPENWKNPFVSPTMWIGLADVIAGKISHHGEKLYKSPRLFGAELFSDYLALFSVHCLHKYANQQPPTDGKLQAAAKLFF